MFVENKAMHADLILQQANVMIVSQLISDEKFSCETKTFWTFVVTLLSIQFCGLTSALPLLMMLSQIFDNRCYRTTNEVPFHLCIYICLCKVQVSCIYLNTRRELAIENNILIDATQFNMLNTTIISMKEARIIQLKLSHKKVCYVG